VLVLGDVLRVDVDSYLVQRRLRVLADLVPILGHDRDLAHLGQKGLRQLVDLSRGRRPAGEDPEVDPDLEPWWLRETLVERELRLSTHRNP